MEVGCSPLLRDVGTESVFGDGPVMSFVPLRALKVFEVVRPATAYFWS